MQLKRTYPYRLLNVFAESVFGGNPLCVFEHAEGLSDAEMQALALQFNLSETCFILPSDKASARMRIFTPDTEMAFAGHPSIGTASVVQDVHRTGERLTLECKAGIVPLHLEDEVWTFAAPQAPKAAPCQLNADEISRMLSLECSDLLAEPQWMNTGSDQLLIPLKSVEAVRRAKLNGALLDKWPKSSLGRQTGYVFAFEESNAEEPATVHVTARYFFVRAGGGIGEDPATGSACANLGGWWLESKRPVPARIEVAQGAQINRPSQLYLALLGNKTIQVGGKVVEIGRGVIQI
ncbi:PhzF family phenazine biosynthesis protein [Undibacterium sp. RuRC25W]|uniref:PhzF family phenazine biosynthesis protein n=1 Tax=Undibacterium sp. RuRC25W TaxID=3413047 RepID=UPI003BF0D655